MRFNSYILFISCNTRVAGIPQHQPKSQEMHFVPKSLLKILSDCNMNVWPSVKSDVGEKWGNGLCACSGKMVSNVGGWVPQSAVSLKCSSFKVNLNIASIDNYSEDFALYALN